MVDARTISKVTLPDLTRAISRPRLLQRVAAATGARAILITGQAAQGKSTLAAAIARVPGPTAAWMHLDPSDADPVNFFHLLVYAVKAARPNLEVSHFLKNPAIALGTDAGSSRIAELVGVFMDDVVARSPIRIVIDGIDRIGDHNNSLMLVHRILDRISPPGRLVLVSRETPPLKLESLRIRQELISLNNDDLAFAADEIGRFFQDLYGLSLAPPQLGRIGAITDGWAGGLVLVWEALSRVPDDQRMAFIDNGLPAAMQGERLAFFSETIFAGLDATTRSFLVRSAIFDTIEPKMAGRYLQDQAAVDVAAILDSLVRQNMFIHPLFDPLTGWGYRYNQLFRDFLLDKFHSTLDPSTQRSLFTRAADLAWDGGNFEGAIHFFLQAEAYDKAAAGIKKIAMGLSAQGRFADLTGWIEVLPVVMIDDDAWLCFYRAMGRRIKGGRRNIGAFSKALDRFRSEGDQRGQLLAMAYLIETAVFIGHSVTALSRWLATAWDMLETVSGNRYYAFAKAVLWMQVAFGYLSGAGDLQKGLSACRNALLLANTIGDDTLTVNATVIHAFGLTLTGEFAAAEDALVTIQRLVAAAYPEYRALQNIVRMELALSQGDLTGAQRLQDANQEDIDTFGLLFLYPIHVDLSGLLQIHQRRFDALGRTARHLKDVATLAANPFYSGLAFRLRALKAYHQDRFEHAHMWGEQAAEVIQMSLGDSIHLFRCRLIQGMAAYHLKDLDGARQALESARDFFSRVSSHLSLVETHLGLSLVAAAMGEREAADRHVDAALAMAVAQGYETTPILSTRDMVAACAPAIAHARPDRAARARRLMGDGPADAGEMAPENGKNRSARPRLLPARGPSDTFRSRLDIRTFGGFEVRRGDGTVIPDAKWAGQRQKLLLKAIVVNGCREIPKDILMDAIWPDSSTDASLKCLKVTLHRLRKILEPEMDPHAGSSFIYLKDNLISLDMDGCRVDVNAFLAACDDIRQLKRDDDDERLLSACQRAVEIYGGEFLPEEPYLSWAEMKRSALKAQYIAVLMEMAALVERNGDLVQAARFCDRAILADPLAEHACQQLMRLLQRQGRRSAALKVYRDLEHKLAAELDTIPDHTTTRIYDDIVNTGK